MDVSPSRVRKAWEQTGRLRLQELSLNPAEQPIKGLLNYFNDSRQALKRTRRWDGGLAGICKQRSCETQRWD